MYKDSILIDKQLLTRFDERITYVKKLGSAVYPVYEVEVTEKESNNQIRIFVNSTQFVRWNIPSDWMVGDVVKFKHSQDQCERNGYIHSLKPFTIEYFLNSEPEIYTDIHPYNVTVITPLTEETYKEQADCQFEILKEALERILVKGNLFSKKINLTIHEEDNTIEWEGLSITSTTIGLKSIRGVKEVVGWQIDQVGGKDYYDVDVVTVFEGLLTEATTKFVELVAKIIIEIEFDQYSTECLSKAYREEMKLDFSTIGV